MQTLANLWFIPSHHLEAEHNYNKEKVITTNKITATTGINEPAKMPLLKYIYIIYIYIYIYIIQGDIFVKISNKYVKKI